MIIKVKNINYILRKLLGIYVISLISILMIITIVDTFMILFKAMIYKNADYSYLGEYIYYKGVQNIYISMGLSLFFTFPITIYLLSNSNYIKRLNLHKTGNKNIYFVLIIFLLVIIGIRMRSYEQLYYNSKERSKEIENRIIKKVSSHGRKKWTFLKIQKGKLLGGKQITADKLKDIVIVDDKKIITAKYGIIKANKVTLHTGYNYGKEDKFNTKNFIINLNKVKINKILKTNFILFIINLIMIIGIKQMIKIRKIIILTLIILLQINLYYYISYIIK